MPQIEGFDTPGDDRGLVVNVQGIAGGTPIPISGSGSGGASQADDSAFTVNTDGVNPIGALVDDTGTDTVQEGRVGVPRMSALRALYANPYSATATVTSVADSASNVTLLAANVARVGATFFNDSTELLYLKLGSTATTSSFTVKVNPQGYYELPSGYAGIVDGIWAADGSGAARVTELS